jgi:hypothetical protein
MDTQAIDEEKAQQMVSLIMARAGSIEGLAVSSEIQDLGEFVLFSLDASKLGAAWPLKSQEELLKTLTSDLSTELPERNDDYRWMVTVLVGGKVVNSCFGGWRGKPPVL